MNGDRDIAICYDAADARAFLDARPAACALALTPEARAVLCAGGADVVSSSACFSDRDHARTLVWVRRAERMLREGAGGAAALPPAAREYLIDAIVTLGTCAGRLWWTLKRARGRGASVLLRDGTTWRRFDGDDPTPLAGAVLRRMPASAFGLSGHRSPPLPAVYRLVRRLLTRKLGRAHSFVASPRPKLTFGLHGSLARCTPAAGVCVGELATGWREYPKLVRAAWLVLSGRSRDFRFAFLGGRDPAARRAAQRLIGSLPLPAMRAVVSQRRAELIDATEYVATAARDAVDALQALRPAMFVSYQCSSVPSRVLAEAAGRAGLHRLMYNFNSHTTGHGAIGDLANGRHYRLKVVNELSDSFLCWSPRAYELARALLGPDAPADAVRPVLSLPAQPPAADGNRRPVVLHAGSFLGWTQTLPWILETSDEYCDSIVTLAEAMRALTFADLVVRAKEKSECAPEHLRTLLPEAPNLRITDTSRPFHAALSGCDLLVSFMSTTIEEALHWRKPVLLWGPTRRYLHLPARRTPPTPDDRAAVYAAVEPEELAPMIRAILAAHRGRPLTDGEIRPHVWPLGTPTTDDVARAIVSGRLGDAWTGRDAAPAEPQREVA